MMVTRAGLRIFGSAATSVGLHYAADSLLPKGRCGIKRAHQAQIQGPMNRLGNANPH